MAPSLFRSSSSSGISLFEIRLDQNPIVLRGSARDVPGALLKGTLVLLLNTPLYIRGVHLTLKGEKQVGWYSLPMVGLVSEKNRFLQETWHFIPPTTRMFGEIVPARNYSWNFEYQVRGDRLESVEGSQDTYIIYRLKATIDRGVLHPNNVIERPVRIIRTPEPSSLELCQPASVEDIWLDKLKYSITLPSKAVVFGSAVRIEFKLVPLAKGLTVESISAMLIEKCRLRLSKGPENTDFRTILRYNWELPAELETVEIDDDQYGHKLHRSIQFPRNLTTCLQSVNTTEIRIKHRLQFILRLRNADGHQSRIEATIPISLFLSPYLAPNDENTIDDGLGANIDNVDILPTAVPPQYGAHQFDELYSEVDRGGHMTPMGGSSGFNTPFAPGSRSTSVDNLVSAGGQISRGWVTVQRRLQNLDISSSEAELGPLRRISNGEGSASGSGLVSPHTSTMLASELSNAIDTPLHVSSTSQSVYRPLAIGIPPSAVSTPPTSGPSATLNRPATFHTGPTEADVSASNPTNATRTHVVFDTEALCKVPSYGTARNSRPPVLVHRGLPDYESAVRAPDVGSAGSSSNLDPNLSEAGPSNSSSSGQQNPAS